ncbi:MAG: Na/Pi cotransporter family protein [Desulfobacterales bacterium]|nr:Na/Pi cotransporter family protein [Deltaproteobacteria bacterium]NNK95526.1 Na/Pi cotransporter family protein [Desulfobacterales bacterium]
MLYLLFPDRADAASNTDEISWFFLVVGLLGGLSLFLYGMDRMSDALKNVAGEKMKDILAMLSSNRIMGVITGAVVTAVIQSSSVTTVMLVGFVTAGLMSLSQSIGVILGADIGTTITAQIVAFKVTKYALLLLAVGFGMLFISKKEKIQQYGYMVMGLGMIFFGMSVMSDAMYPLRTYQPFIDLMASMSNPVLGILIGALFTALIQSSSAAMGVVIVLAMQGLISLEAGIALALGANIGTCATAGLASIGKPREAVRVATCHVLFKIVGVVLMAPFIGPFAKFVVLISPSAAEGLIGMEAAAAVVPRQVANAHTIFNIGIALLFLPFVTQFSRIVYRLVPDKPIKEIEKIQPKYLSEMLFETPSLALDAARHEIKRMGKRIDKMNSAMMPAVLSGNKESLLALREMYIEVDILHKHLVTYLARVSQLKLNEFQTKKFINLMTAVNNLDYVGDLIEVNMVGLGMRRVEKGFKISAATQEVLETLHVVASDALKAAVRAVVEEDKDYAARVISMQDDINHLIAKADLHQAKRLVSKDSGKFEAYSVEVDIIEKLKRMYKYAREMAKTVVGDGEKIVLEEAA